MKILSTNRPIWAEIIIDNLTTFDNILLSQYAISEFTDPCYLLKTVMVIYLLLLNNLLFCSGPEFDSQSLQIHIYFRSGSLYSVWWQSIVCVW